MHDVQKLIRSLTAIDQVALAVVLDSRRDDHRDALCRVIEQHKPIVGADYQRQDIAVWQRKLVGIFEQILTLSGAVQGRPDPDRFRLIVSYIRTMRGFIANMLLLLAAPGPPDAVAAERPPRQ